MTDVPRVQAKVAALLVEVDGRLDFDPLGREKVAALIEVAARLRDQAQGAAALLDLLRLSLALEDGGHRAAARALEELLKTSPAAMARLSGARHRDAATHARFERFSARAEPKRAPRHDAERPAEGVELKDLLPPGVGRRLEPKPKPKAGPATAHPEPAGPAKAGAARRRFDVK